MQHILKNIRVQTSLTIIMSLFLHMVVITAMLLPDLKGLMNMTGSRFGGDSQPAWVTMNINEDNRRQITKITMLSDRDSTAKGYLTQKKDKFWYNASDDFKIIQGQIGDKKEKANIVTQYGKKVHLADEADMIVKEVSRVNYNKSGLSGEDILLSIPGIYDDNFRENALHFSDDGRLSFNTMKYKNYDFMKRMQDKMRNNWFPPIMANTIIYGSVSGDYAPGRTRIMAITSQYAALSFAMNREGDVLAVKLVESSGLKPLDNAMLDTITLSKNFGKVPDDFKGDVIVIPIVFHFFLPKAR